MAVVSKVNLFSRQIIERLSVSGIDMMLDRVCMLSEGQLSAGQRYFGSTMLTLDVRELGEQTRDSCDASTTLRLARLLGHSEAAIDRIRHMAHTEATRIAGSSLAPSGIDVKIRAEAYWIFIDVDIEGRLIDTVSSSTG